MHAMARCGDIDPDLFLLFEQGNLLRIMGNDICILSKEELPFFPHTG